ncbi:Histidinol-phosphate aminotransferase 2 [Candidatus Nitrosocosmicus oleophilus]|uniref:Histidinol-phosphate aminotransferase 2 n=1 Tax=Candidatus Nitrosocosmicus oleophilus TaxID=1353260 RepID=A0A654LVE3_9ARCH|nr:histidinol-phosphate transaminase [Candidatus Nitrosocosmicus oleophilus]ALI34957.1 Histidinol-phosphate aminotransferase 2 [Candidatus Nitrosocosmicus oleophilus]
MVGDWLDKELAHIKSYKPYKRPEKIHDFYKLDSNENLVLEQRFIKSIASKSLHESDFREYPIEQFEKLYTKLAEYTKLSTRNIGIGSGSDQIMDLLLSTIGKGKKVITVNPTFSYFTDRCNLYKIPTKLIDLSAIDNSFDLELFIKKARDYDIIYIASPNNPTGNQFKLDDISSIIDILKDKMIIIDEAYVEFAEYSLSDIVTKYHNVLIMRTFSKAFGLAGARIGYILANEEISDVFNQYIQLPYPLSSFSMQLAIEALDNIQIVNRSIEVIKRERTKIFDRLNKLDKIKIFKSDSNFFFFQTFSHYNNIKNQLLNERILIKNFGDLGNYNGAMRITIGNTEMNDKVISVIEKSLAT